MISKQSIEHGYQNNEKERYDFLKFTALKALCNNYSLNFKKFWSSYECESKASPGMKVVHHVILHNILEG